jgi:antitoxin HicB
MAEIGKATIGSSLNEWLEEEGFLEEATSEAIKAVLAYQLSEAMKAQGLTKIAMAKAMNTSRAQLDRLLNPENGNVTLESLQRAAKAVGREIRLELV